MMPFNVSDELLDRDHSLREVDLLIDEARSTGSAAVVRIAGPAGIGKTAFLRYFLAHRPSLPKTLTASMQPAGRVRHAACLRALLHLRIHPNANEDDLHFALDDAVGGGATIAIDDAQWIDEVSERLLRDAMLRYGSALIVLFTDRREVTADLRPHRTVRLRPLRTAAGIRIVRSIFPDAAPTVAVEIVSAASGLPFAVQFLATAAAQRAARSPEDVDPSLAAAIGVRMERCSERARDTIRYCAFLGAPADLRIVARAAGMTLDEAATALTELGDLIIVHDLHAVFRHGLIGEAITSSTENSVPYYQHLLDAHDRADERPETLGAIMRCAQGCGDSAATAATALRLGQIFASSGSLATSLEHLKIALRHAPRPLPVIYSLAYSSVLQQFVRDEDAAEFLRAELRSAISRCDASAIAGLMTSFSSVALTLELTVEFDALVERVGPLVQTSAPGALETLHTARLASLVFSGRLDEAERFASSIPLRWEDKRALAFAAAMRGDADTARKQFDAYRACLEFEHDRLARGDRALLATIGLFSIGNSALLGTDHGWGDERDRGTYATGTALRILRRINDGRWSEIDAIVEHLRLDDPDLAEPYAILDARLLFSGVARRAPAAPQRALRAIRTMIAQGRKRHAVAAARWFWIGCSYANQLVPADLSDFVARSLDVQPMPYLIGGIPLAIGLLRPRLGTKQCVAALEHAEPFGSRWHRAHAELAAGMLSDDVGALRRARDGFDALDAPVFAMFAGIRLPIPRARDVALARALGVDAGVADSEALGSMPLTKREREVAELAAQGLSNREIAARTQMKERTVETHLTSVFRKLGVRSRSGLAPALLRLVYGES